MVNEDILTSLKNAVAKGESLDSAIQTSINSGYNARDVQEAAQYIGAGVVHLEKTSQDRMLTMPNQKKGFFSNIFSKKQTNQPSQPVQYQSQSSQLPIPPQYNTNRTQTQSQEMSYSSIPLPAQIQQPPTKVRAPINQPIQTVKTTPQPISQPPQRIQIPSQPPPKPIPQKIQPPPKPTPQTSPQAYTETYSYIPGEPKKQSYVKEIILLVMLLILAGILVITFRYRDVIVAFFSGG